MSNGFLQLGQTSLRLTAYGGRSPVVILPAVAESERLVPLCRCAVKQANVVHHITAAGLVIDAAIIPHHEIPPDSTCDDTCSRAPSGKQITY